MKVLSAYIRAMGGWTHFGLLMLWFLLTEVARVAATVWLSHWTDVADQPGARQTSTVNALLMPCAENGLWRARHFVCLLLLCVYVTAQGSLNRFLRASEQLLE